MPRGSLHKIDIQAKVLRLKHQLIVEKSFHPEWNDFERNSANVTLNRILDIIDEYSN